jgi:tetratricopeptide (TPR) repeat protein
MNQSLGAIKKLLRIVEDAVSTPEKNAAFKANIEGALEEKGLSSKTILALADSIGTKFSVSPENIHQLKWFADFLGTYLYEYVRSIRIYLAIIQTDPVRSDVYRKLMDIYLYDINRISGFDFLANAAAVSVNLRDIDLVSPRMSYTYMGVLYQRIGRFQEARKAYDLALGYPDEDGRKSVRHAQYGIIELDYIAEVANSTAFVQERTASAKPPLLLGVNFFGAAYERLFRTVAGRTFFCKKNIKALKERWTPYCVIFCTLFERMQLENSALYKHIATQMPVKIYVVNDYLFSAFPDQPPAGYDQHPALKYSLSGLLQTCLVMLARTMDASLVNLPPDAIFADSTMDTISEAASSGSKVVFTPGIRLKRADVVDELNALVKSGPIAALSSDTLTTLALRNLHPATQASFGTHEKVTHPGMLWWPAGQGLFGHCFQMHPIFVRNDVLRNSPLRRFDSIDGDFVFAMLPNAQDWESIYVVTDPERAMMFELSGPNVPTDIKYTMTDLALSAGSWVASVMRPLSFWLLQKRVAFGNIAAPETAQRLRDADRVVESFIALKQKITFCTSQQSQTFLKQTDLECETLALTWRESDRNVNPYRTNTRVPVRMGEDPGAVRVLYSIAVWGERYIENFLNICLPSMLAEGNLGGLPNNRHSLFLLYIRPEELPLFEANVQYQRLKRLIPVEVVSLDMEAMHNKYSLLSTTQSDSVQRSGKFDAICFLYADFLFAKGSIRNSVARLAEGYDGVISPVPPLILEEFYHTLTTHYDTFVQPSNEDGAFDIVVDPRTLIKHAKLILHPMMRDNVVDYKLNTVNPAYMLWLGPGDDLLIRCFHSHPVMLRVKHHEEAYWKPFDQTLDEVFLPMAYPAADRLYVVKDFPTPYNSHNQHHHLDAESISRWGESCAAPLHKLLFDYPTFWHEHEIDLAAWQPVVERSKATAREVRFRLTLPDSVQKHEAPLSYQARISRLGSAPLAVQHIPVSGGRTTSLRRILLIVIFIVGHPILNRMSRETRLRIFSALPSQRLRKLLLSEWQRYVHSGTFS